MDKSIQQSISGKRFAVMGFDTREADSIIAALGTASGSGHVVGATPNIPGLNSFSPFDACVINASAVVAPEQPAPIDRISRSNKPAVIIGSAEDLTTKFPALVDINREFILRPYEADELLLRTYRVLRFVEVAAEINQPESRNGTRRAVLADDDATTVVMISTILKHFHFECEIARNGQQALEIARKKRPDLVLLDVSMPDMDGFTALTALRGDMMTRNTPVILVSAHRDEAEVVKGFSLGAADYVTKPFSSGELIARINRVLRAPDEI